MTGKSLKIAIVGAGINGLYLAWKLSSKGHSVTVFDRKKEVGNAVCSGLFSERILDFIPLASNLIQNEGRFTTIHFPKKTIRVWFSKKFFVMEHSKLDELTASLAKNAGAKIVLDQNISALPQGFDRIIGCDGANSFIRKQLGLTNPVFRLGILGFIKNKIGPADLIETWPCPNGFIWKIPRGQEIEYGIISNLKNSRTIFEKFLAKNNIVLERMQSRVIPQGLIIPDSDAVTLCGDAAGLTKPWSGGGVIWGLTAADILLQSFPDFLLYKKGLKKFFLPKIWFAKTAAKIIYFLGNNVPWLMPSNPKAESDFLL